MRLREPVTGPCAVCLEPGTSECCEPGGDTFWLCDRHLAECVEVGREGQYVTLEDAANDI